MDEMKRKKNLEETDDVTFDEEVETLGEDSELARVALKASRQKKDLESCLQEKAEYLDGWQRARADIANMRKQFEGERRDIETSVEQGFALTLLTALDSFDMAFANREAWEKVESNWRTGVEYIHQQLLSALGEHNVTSFSPLGEPFNPEEHESVSIEIVQDPSEENRVLTVLQRGYRHREKIMRPAKVIVGHYEK